MCIVCVHLKARDVSGPISVAYSHGLPPLVHVAYSSILSSFDLVDRVEISIGRHRKF